MVIGTDSVTAHNYTVGNISMDGIQIISSGAPSGSEQPWLTAGVGPYCAAGTGWQLNSSSIRGSATVWVPHRAECSIATSNEIKLDVDVRCIPRR
jgi:hypothetical protein